MDQQISKISLYDKVSKEIDKGIAGENQGVTIGFPFLDNYISLRKKIYTVIFAGSGVGKSSFASEAYILNPIDWYLENRHNTKKKLKIHLFSMERSSTYMVCKFLSRKIFLDQGVTIPISKMLGWGKDKLTSNEHDYVAFYKDYLGEFEEIVKIYDGAINPTGIYKIIKEFAHQNGKVEQVSEFEKRYIENDPNLITQIMVDHQSRLRTEQGLNTKKDAIDKTSAHLQHARDFYNFSPLMIAQSGRQLSNLIYSTKIDTFEPTPEQIMDSSLPYFDSDVCISLFDPIYFNTNSPTGHDAARFKDNRTGAKFFRSLKIHKNTFGESDIRKGLVFHGAVGTFKEIPRSQDTPDSIYDDVISTNYFLKT